MLAALLHDARKDIEALGIDAALIQLATHAWFEGGIEGYAAASAMRAESQGPVMSSEGIEPVPLTVHIGPAPLGARRVS